MFKIDRLIKKITAVSIILVFFGIFSGMGNSGNLKNTEIPEPETDLTATLIDQEGLSSRITRFSLEGNTFIPGKRGGATVNIPFENIQKLDFRKRGNDLDVVVSLKKGETVELKMDEGQNFYGKLPYGTLSIKAGQVKRITIEGLTGN